MHFKPNNSSIGQCLQPVRGKFADQSVLVSRKDRRSTAKEITESERHAEKEKWRASGGSQRQEGRVGVCVSVYMSVGGWGFVYHNYPVK